MCISITVTKANKILGSIKRSVGTANANVFSMLYKSLVQPILEYAAPVWCPYLVKNIHALENVRRRASRLALNQRKGNMSYEDRCKLLKWPTLSDRRTFLSLIECYKIVFGFYHLKFEDFFYFAFSILNLNLNCISIFNCIDLDFYFIFIYLFILF